MLTLSSIGFNRSATSEALQLMNGSTLADGPIVNPVLLVFTGELSDGTPFAVHTNRWAAGHTEAFHARLVLPTGERLALPVVVPEEKMKRSYHDRWFAQYPARLAEVLEIPLENAQEIYATLTAEVLELEREIYPSA